jgi:hypothetical protein
LLKKILKFFHFLGSVADVIALFGGGLHNFSFFLGVNVCSPENTFIKNEKHVEEYHNNLKENMHFAIPFLPACFCWLCAV